MGQGGFYLVFRDSNRHLHHHAMTRQIERVSLTAYLLLALRAQAIGLGVAMEGEQLEGDVAVQQKDPAQASRLGTTKAIICPIVF